MNRIQVIIIIIVILVFAGFGVFLFVEGIRAMEINPYERERATKRVV